MRSINVMLSWRFTCTLKLLNKEEMVKSMNR